MPASGNKLPDLLRSALRVAINLAGRRPGHNAGVFAIFVVIATILWMATSLNRDVQRDVRLPLKINGVPDSAVCVSHVPADVAVSMRGSATAMFRLGRKAIVNVDYPLYARYGHLSLSATQLRGLAQNALGNSVNVMAVSPDTISLDYTTRPPVKLPVAVDARITTLPNCTITGAVTSSVDTVRVYSSSYLPDDYTVVRTAPIRLTDVARTTKLRVPLELPRGARAIPDSVDVTINVEPMISRSVKVPVQPVNVPQGYRMILLPNTVTVNYTVPMSKYSDRQARFVVTADYKSLSHLLAGNRIAVNVTRADGNFINVYTSTDSVEYILERR